MSEPSLKKQITAYLAKANMMQLATANGDKPWICNVWFAADKDLNIYWISSSNRRHSIELSDNPHVAAAICTVREPSEGDNGAIQLEGLAHEVSDSNEINHAMDLYVERGFFTKQQVEDFMANPEFPHRFYRIKPTRIVYYDANQDISTREYVVN